MYVAFRGRWEVEEKTHQKLLLLKYDREVRPWALQSAGQGVRPCRRSRPGPCSSSRRPLAVAQQEHKAGASSTFYWSQLKLADAVGKEVQRVADLICNKPIGVADMEVFHPASLLPAQLPTFMKALRAHQFSPDNPPRLYTVEQVRGCRNGESVQGRRAGGGERTREPSSPPTPLTRTPTQPMPLTHTRARAS